VFSVLIVVLPVGTPSSKLYTLSDGAMLEVEIKDMKIGSFLSQEMSNAVLL